MSPKSLFTVLALIFLEWLDFTLYLYLAKSVFASHFFPSSQYSLVLSFALFAAAYIARPLGGWYFGRHADRHGRRKPLIASAALMGFCTLGIALLPEYSVIGFGATWGLLIFRIGQGLALGGEINTSAMFLIEHHPHRPLFIGSLVAAFGAGGMFLGGAAAAIIQSTNIDGLWRIIFVVVGFISLAVCQLRKTLKESPEFQSNTQSFSTLIKEYPQGITLIAISAVFVSMTVYLCNAFWVSYATNQGFWAPGTCAWAGSIAQLCSALLALPIAWYSSPKQATSLLRSSMLVSCLSAPLLFGSTTLAFTPGVILGLMTYIVTNGLLCSALFYFLYLQLPAKYRCRGVSTIWALAATLGAISLPLAEEAHIHHHFWFAPLCIMTIGFSGFWLLKPLQKSGVQKPRQTVYSHGNLG